jgi:SNF family Na+-dependent transporter
MIGYTVGFGSFWRFPYLVYENGGGVFLIPYIIAMAFFGVPLLYLETAVGQMYQLPITKIFESINRALKPLGFVVVLVSFMISTYYNLLLAYSYRYIFASFSDPLPFANEATADGTYFN